MYFLQLEGKRPIGRFPLALAEGLEHSSLLLTLSKISVKKSFKKRVKNVVSRGVLTNLQ